LSDVSACLFDDLRGRDTVVVPFLAEVCRPYIFALELAVKRRFRGHTQLHAQFLRRFFPMIAATQRLAANEPFVHHQIFASFSPRARLVAQVRKQSTGFAGEPLARKCSSPCGKMTISPAFSSSRSPLPRVRAPFR